MALLDDYRDQFKWRDWKTPLKMCPIKPGHRVLDLGCGPGDISRELLTMGAQVTGIDSNSELIEAAIEQNPSGTFMTADLESVSQKIQEGTYDGIWCSFTAAYFPNLSAVLDSWLICLKKHSWICIVEIDDLLGHEPMPTHYRDKVLLFYKEASSWYDFIMGRKIPGLLESKGFHTTTVNLNDRELSFQGPAGEEVYQAWVKRMERMAGPKKFFGKEYDDFKRAYLETISSSEHRSLCKIICSVGVRD